MLAGPRTSDIVRTGLALALLLALVAAWSPMVGATQSSAEGPSEGITVHGDWTIDVLAADGEHLETHEFSNALVNDGKDALAALVLGRVADYRMIGYDCGPATQFCLISEPGADGSSDFITDSEAETLTAERSTGSVVTLQGTAVAANDFTLTNVRTFLDVPTDGQREVQQRGWLTFTSKNLAPADQIDLIEGQQLVIRVEISFS
jgi:hypothetical protein